MNNDFLEIKGFYGPIQIPLCSISSVKRNGIWITVEIDNGMNFPFTLESEDEAEIKFKEIKEDLKKFFSGQVIRKEDIEG